MAVTLPFNVYPLSQKYANGLDQVEAGLITYPGDGSVYISPALIPHRGGKRTTLAAMLNERDIKPGQDVEIVMAGDTFKLIN